MKRDVKLTLENGSFDFEIENGDLKNEEGFDTSIWVSLFTDSRANENQILIPEYRRGWLGNLVSDVSERQLGSFLWLTEQTRLTQETLNSVIDYTRKSLNWLVDDGIATKIEVDGAIVPRRGISLTVVITAPDGTTSNHYVPLWEATGDAN